MIIFFFGCISEKIVDLFDVLLCNIMCCLVLEGVMDYYKVLYYEDLVNIFVGIGNLFMFEKVEFGKMFFFEIVLGVDVVNEFGM